MRLHMTDRLTLERLSSAAERGGSERASASDAASPTQGGDAAWCDAGEDELRGMLGDERAHVKALLVRG